LLATCDHIVNITLKEHIEIILLNLFLHTNRISVLSPKHISIKYLIPNNMLYFSPIVAFLDLLYDVWNQCITNIIMVLPKYAWQCLF